MKKGGEVQAASAYWSVWGVFSEPCPPVTGSRAVLAPCRRCCFEAGWVVPRSWTLGRRQAWTLEGFGSPRRLHCPWAVEVRGEVRLEIPPPSSGDPQTRGPEYSGIILSDFFPMSPIFA